MAWRAEVRFGLVGAWWAVVRRGGERFGEVRIPHIGLLEAGVRWGKVGSVPVRLGGLRYGFYLRRWMKKIRGRDGRDPRPERKPRGMVAKTKVIPVLAGASNGGEETILMGAPYTVRVVLEGTSKMLFHRYNVESVEAKAKAPKGSAAKKTDDIESYVYRLPNGRLAVPSEWLRGAVINAAKYRQDPRSPRKSAMDLFRAAIVVTNDLADLGVKTWEFVDRRRVNVQRSGVPRERPGVNEGWRVTFDVMVLLPEYVSSTLLREVIVDAGRLCGLGDFRPTFGRFSIAEFKVL